MNQTPDLGLILLNRHRVVVAAGNVARRLVLRNPNENIVGRHISDVLVIADQKAAQGRPDVAVADAATHQDIARQSHHTFRPMRLVAASANSSEDDTLVALLAASDNRQPHAQEKENQTLETFGHEMRTHLTAILGFADLMLAPEADAGDQKKKREYLEDIRYSGGRMLALLDDLQEAAAPKKTHNENDETTDVRNAVAASVRAVEKQAAEKQVVLRFAADPISARCETSTLERILIALLSSAVRGASVGSAATVSTRKNPDATIAIDVRASFNDDAINDLDAIFEPDLLAVRSLAERRGGALAMEIEAANEYLAHAAAMKAIGYQRLAETFRKEADEETRHAEAIMERIFFLGDVPDAKQIKTAAVENDVAKLFTSLLADELDTRTAYENAIADAAEARDSGTRKLFETLVAAEEEHILFLRRQLSLLYSIGEKRYLQLQVGSAVENAE